MGYRILTDDTGKILARTHVSSSAKRKKTTAQVNALNKAIGLQSAQPERENLDTLKSLDLVEFNGRAEQAFIKLIREYISQVGELSPRQVYSEASYELNISIETAKRYLLKHTARRAEFVISGGKVGLR
jgi:hypothetical protein